MSKPDVAEFQSDKSANVWSKMNESLRHMGCGIFPSFKLIQYINLLEIVASFTWQFANVYDSQTANSDMTV